MTIARQERFPEARLSCGQELSGFRTGACPAFVTLGYQIGANRFAPGDKLCAAAGIQFLGQSGFMPRNTAVAIQKKFLARREKSRTSAIGFSGPWQSEQFPSTEMIELQKGQAGKRKMQSDVDPECKLFWP